MPLSILVNTLDNADAEELSAFLEDTFVAIEDSGVEEEWQEHTGLMLAAVVPALVWQRENEDARFDVATIKNHFALDNVIRLYGAPEMPEPLQETLAEYLASLPEFDPSNYDADGEARPEKKAEAAAARSQHTKILQIFFSALDTLAG